MWGGLMVACWVLVFLTRKRLFGRADNRVPQWPLIAIAGAVMYTVFFIVFLVLYLRGTPAAGAAP